MTSFIIQLVTEHPYSWTELLPWVFVRVLYTGKNKEGAVTFSEDLTLCQILQNFIISQSPYYHHMYLVLRNRSSATVV